MTAVLPRRVHGSVDELLAGATRREPFRSTDSKSGSRFERVVIDGERYVVKYVHVDDDWTMRGNGDVACRTVRAYAAGLTDALPERIDPAIAGVATGFGRNGWGAAVLMRDVSPWLVPAGDDPIGADLHAQFLDDCAALCARLWGWRDTVGLMPYEHRWRWFSDDMLAIERTRGEPVPDIAAEGWARFRERAPRAAREVVAALRAEPHLLGDALARTPLTFLHGDWKLGNLGRGPDGRTLLLDWAYPGAGPACHELAWYLALNRARLPVGQAKEDAIAAFRAALERHGVGTAGWWDAQCALSLLGAVVQFGWEKALGDGAELGWWCDRAVEGARWL